MSANSIVKVSNLRNQKTIMPGKVFGRYVVIGYGPVHIFPNGTPCRMYICCCACGNIRLVGASNFNHHSTSCGCLKKEQIIRRFTKHGSSYTRTYNIWQAMKHRCENQEAVNYERYGARGIFVCNRWLQSFEAFLADMGKCPDGQSIERIDNEGPYSPENCRWATPLDQGNNKRNNVILTHDGQKRTLSQWSRIIGIDYKVLYARVFQLHWSDSKTLTTPVRILKHT